MEHRTSNPEPSWPQSAYTRAYAAAEPGRTLRQLGHSNDLSRSAFSLADYGHYNAYASVAAPGNYTNATPWATSPLNDHAFGPLISSNTLQLTGSTFPAGVPAGVADHDGTALPTAPIPYAWGATPPTIYSKNNIFAPSSLTGSTFAANAAYDGGITYPTAPSPYALGAAAPMNHYMGPAFNYPDPALPIMDPFAADTNGIGYHGQFPIATSLSTQFGAATALPNTSDATHPSDTAPSVLFQQAPPPSPRPTCATCGRNFRRKADLERHAKKHKTDARVHRCGCGYSSYRKDKLDEHVRRSGHRAATVVVSGDGV